MWREASLLRLSESEAQSEGFGRVRAAIDQIADSEEAVGIGVKAKLAQRAVQGAKAAVHVADDKIAPARTGANRADPDTLQGRSPHSMGRARFRHERRTPSDRERQIAPASAGMNPEP